MKFEYFRGKQTNYKIIFHEFEKYEKNAKNIGYKRLNQIKMYDSMIKTNYHIKIIFFVFSLNFAHLFNFLNFGIIPRNVAILKAIN